MTRYIAALVTSIAIGACTPSSASNAPVPPLQPSAQKAPEGLAAAASPPGTEGLDLSITFHPGFSDHIGWAKLPKPVPFQYLGNLGATVLRIDKDWDRIGRDELLLRIFEAQLARTEWETTSVMLGEAELCAQPVQDAINRANPARLLLRIEGGLTARGTRCLATLKAPRLYLAGCLYRSHRAEDTCNGDAEVSALAAHEAVRKRVSGLALSLSGNEAVTSLGEFPELEYLAIVAGREASPNAGFSELPFGELGHVRYLDVSNWQTDQVVWGKADELRFFAQLHTLRWDGEISLPIHDCSLRRLGGGRLSKQAMTAFSPCGELLELSNDGASFEDATSLLSFPRLKWLHLRHWSAAVLAPLTKLHALEQLSLPASAARNFDFIASLPQLKDISLSQTALSDLTTFSKLEQLETLDAGFTKVSDLKPLARLAGLKDLNLHETLVTDVSPLSSLQSLQKLSLSGTSVKDLGPLAGHPGLSWLILYGSQVTDVRPLLTMPKLERVNLGGLSLPAAQLRALGQRPGMRLDGP